jgi:hypothetical protein
MKALLIYFIIAITLMTIACGSHQNQEKVTLAADSADSVGQQVIDTSSSSAEQGEEEALSDVNISFIMPSPDEIFGEIIPEKVSIDMKLVNPLSNTNKYLSTKSQALNLGVYIADFAYLNLSDNKTNALEYFKQIRNLAQKVNIYGVLNESFFDRVQKNLTNKDSLKEISKELYYNMLGVLESSNRNNVYSLIASGALIETMYLSSQVVTDFKQYKIIAGKIFEQKFVFDQFYEFASQYKKDADVKAVLGHFDELKAVINSSTSKKTEKNVRVDQKDHFVIEGGEEIVVNEELFKKFKKSLGETRQDIVNISSK